MSEAPDEPLVEIEAGSFSRPDSARFFFRSDGEGPEATEATEGATAEPDTSDDWRAERLRQVLAQRGERRAAGDASVFRLPWSELLKAMSRVLAETDEGADVDRDAKTVLERPVADFAGDDTETRVTPGPIAAAGGGEETVIQDAPELVAAQQEAAYLEGKLARAEEIRVELTARLTQAEASAEATSLQLEQAERSRTRAAGDVQAARDQARQLQAQLEQVREQWAQAEAAADARAARAEEATAAAEAERDVARTETLASHAALQAARAAAAEAEAAREEAEAHYEAARTDSTSVRKRFLQTRQDYEERVDGLEEELQRRTAGHERERASLLDDLRETEQVLRDLFGKLPEAELRGWVPGLEREPWSPETAIRHLVALLSRLEELRGERRQARLLPIPDFDSMRARLDAGRADAPASQQPRLARLKRAIDAGEARFEALREAHLHKQAKLGELLELNTVVASALAHERELGALGL